MDGHTLHQSLELTQGRHGIGDTLIVALLALLVIRFDAFASQEVGLHKRLNEFERQCTTCDLLHGIPIVVNLSILHELLVTQAGQEISQQLFALFEFIL